MSLARWIDEKLAMYCDPDAPDRPMNGPDTGAAWALYEQREYDQSLRAYLDLAEQGHRAADVMIGWMYWQGRGTEKDIDEARRWLERAARDGSREGQYQLGRLLIAVGDPEGSIRWLQSSADQGYSPAFYRLGQLYRFGLGVGKDDERAWECTQRAADLGNIFALKLLANRLRRAGGVRNTLRGYMILLRAIRTVFREAGDTPSKHKLRGEERD
jgi:TPR repeat protein